MYIYTHKGVSILMICKLIKPMHMYIFHTNFFHYWDRYLSTFLLSMFHATLTFSSSSYTSILLFNTARDFTCKHVDNPASTYKPHSQFLHVTTHWPLIQSRAVYTRSSLILGDKPEQPHKINGLRTFEQKILGP